MFNIGDYLTDVNFVLRKQIQNEDTVSKINDLLVRHHISDGYFSMDGIYDGFVELFGDTEIARRLYNQVV